MIVVWEKLPFFIWGWVLVVREQKLRLVCLQNIVFVYELPPNIVNSSGNVTGSLSKLKGFNVLQVVPCVTSVVNQDMYRGTYSNNFVTLGVKLGCQLK